VHLLERLSLRHNELTEAGEAALEDLNIQVHLEGQSEPGSDEYLYSGDME
jgi:hypothetical protein